MNRLTIVQMYRSLAPIGYDPRCEDPPGNAAFLATLPEEIRSEPSIKTVPDLATLSKNYVNAQKLIGTKRVSAPAENWTESNWNEFFDAAGRPKTAGDYKLPEVKLEEGLSLDDKKIGAVKDHLHKLGLSGKQASGVLEYYMNTLNEGVRSGKTATETANASAVAELKTEWGEKYNVNVDLAKGVLKKFGDQNLMNYLETSGMGNNSALIKVLSKIGGMMLEDKSMGKDATFGVKDSTRASAEIDTLKTDKEFMDAFMTQNHPGHKAAVDRWSQLHAVAYPGKEQE